MNEIWKQVEGFEDLYQISNLGRLKSLRKNGKKADSVVKPILNPKTKYYTCLLWRNSKRIGRYYHRLVAQHFIPNPLNLPEVNHIDGNKANNTVSNLQWATKQQNRQHAIKLGLWKHTDSHKKAMGDFNRANKIKKVYQYDKEGNYITEYDSVQLAAIAISGSASNISNCCLNKSHSKSVKGFIFKYKKDD